MERDISAGTFNTDTTHHLHLFTATLVRVLLLYALTREEKEEASRFSFLSSCCGINEVTSGGEADFSTVITTLSPFCRRRVCVENARVYENT